MSSAAPAVRAIARSELARRWRALVLLGLAAGLVVGAVAGTAAIARRTATTLDRLRAATQAEDAKVQVFGDPTAAERVATLPGVTSSWTPSLGVGRIPGSFDYVAVLSGPVAPPDLFQPVVVDGRAADPTDPTQVVIGEAFAAVSGLGVGDALTLEMLTAEEVGQFDVGFGDPDGPTVDLTITGVVRTPPGTTDQNPVLAGAAFAERYGAETSAGRNVYVRLEGGRAGFERFAAEVRELGRELGVPEGAEEFSPVQVVDPTESATSVTGARRVLSVALWSFVGIAATAGLLALTQAFARHQSATVAAQRVEAALGLTAGERARAHALPAVLSAVVAGVVAGAATLAAGAVEPLGPLGDLEPTPGWRPDPLAVALAGTTAVAVVLGLAWATARRAGRRPPAAPPTATSRIRVRATAAARRPAVVAGLWFALFPGRGGRAVPIRSAVISALVGVAGLVGALTFASSLDRLEAEPTRWGWPGDVVVVDATPEIAAPIVADPRTEAVTLMSSSTVELEGRSLAATALTPLEGELAWTVLDGRLPDSDGQVAVGTRVATDLGVRVGDTVEVTGPDGARALDVVGVVVMPRLTVTRLGDDLVVTPADLAALGESAAFTEAMIDVAPGAEEAYAEELAGAYELNLLEPPPEVANLADLGGLPLALGWFLALIGALALVHALVVIVRRRVGDLAVLRAIGCTPRQTGAAVLGTASATVLAAAVVGVPLGLALARLTWWVAASDAGVGAGVAVPWWAVAAVVPAALVLANGIALLPARRAARVRPGPVLRAE